MQNRSKDFGGEELKHDVTVYDPLEVFHPETGALGYSGAELQKPHFFIKGGEARKSMDEMRDAIKAADAFVVVTPEYNHSVPPALSSMIGQ